MPDDYGALSSLIGASGAREWRGALDAARDASMSRERDIRTALDEATAAVQAQRQGQVNLPLLAWAQGIGMPTRTGALGESFAQGLQSAAPAIQRQRDEDAQQQGVLQKLRMAGIDAGHSGALERFQLAGAPLDMAAKIGPLALAQQKLAMEQAQIAAKRQAALAAAGIGGDPRATPPPSPQPAVTPPMTPQAPQTVPGGPMGMAMPPVPPGGPMAPPVQPQAMPQAGAPQAPAPLSARYHALAVLYGNAGDADTSKHYLDMSMAASKDEAEKAQAFGGSGLDAQYLRILRNGDPASQDYAIAYAKAGEPKISMDRESGQTQLITPDMSMFRKPTYQQPGAGAPMAGAPQAAPAAPAAGQPPIPAPAPITQVLPSGGSITTMPGAGKPLSDSARLELKKVADPALAMDALVGGFKDSYGGFGRAVFGDLDNAYKRTVGDDTGQAQFWQQYDSFANLVRNQLFGSALSPGEAANFDKAMVNPGMAPGEIKKNLARQREIMMGAVSRLAHSAVAGGTNPAAIEPLIGMRIGDLPKPIANAAKPEPLSNHIAALRNNPSLSANFDSTYGPGAAERYLHGGR